jgi:hypothetical protein
MKMIVSTDRAIIFHPSECFLLFTFRSAAVVDGSQGGRGSDNDADLVSPLTVIDI